MFDGIPWAAITVERKVLISERVRRASRSTRGNCISELVSPNAPQNGETERTFGDVVERFNRLRHVGESLTEHVFQL